jgi:helix-turn-helix protein
MLYRYISKILETNRPIKDSEICKRLLLALFKGVDSEL